MEQQIFMSPHRVMSLVVMTLSLLMVIGIATLSYVKSDLDTSSAIIHNTTETRIHQIKAAREAAALSNVEEDSDKSNDEEAI